MSGFVSFFAVVLQKQTLVIPFCCFLRYGGITVGNIQKSVPASFGRKMSLMARKIAVRRSAQVSHKKGFLKIGFLKVTFGLISRVSGFSLSLQVLYNNKGYHSMPTYLNVLNNAILRANLPLSKGNPAAYGKFGVMAFLHNFTCLIENQYRLIQLHLYRNM